MVSINWDDVVLVCSCGNVVILHHQMHREENHIVLCNGLVFGGSARFCPQFRRKNRQYEVRVPRDWQTLPIWDRYMLYHVDKEITEILNLVSSLHVSFADAALVSNALNKAEFRLLNAN